MPICYIISAGDCDCVKIKKTEADIVIAADSGLSYCQRDNIVPDIIIGDFDSLGFIPETDSKIILPVEKDDTDTSYAVKFAMEKGFSEFVIFGATGGKRPDHTFANIALLSYISKNGGKGFISDGDYIITSITDSGIRFPAGMKGDISVFSFDEKSTGVTEKGLKYTLDNAVVENCNPIGVSNSFIGQESYVEVANGTLIIYFSGNFSDLSIDKLI